MKFPLSLSLFAVLFVTACGKSDEHSDHDHSDHAHHAATAAPLSDSSVTTENGVTTVIMSGNDRMKFSLEQFTVKAGDSVKLVFNNEGKMPKAAMGHNVVFLVKDADAAAFATAAAMARDSDYIPLQMKDQILAETKLLGPGESDTIEFTAPTEPGQYIYLCTFPAHMYAGMRGVMIVE